MLKMTHRTNTAEGLLRLMSVLIITLLKSDLIKGASAISCYDCRAEDISCNVGECVGATCVKLETSNIDNDRKSVEKGCSKEYEDNQCKQSYLGPKVVLRCTCDSNYCNGDRNLVKAGLQRGSDNGSRAMTTTIGTILLPMIFIIVLLHILVMMCNARK